jgi:hypothetical protein
MKYKFNLSNQLICNIGPDNPHDIHLLLQSNKTALLIGEINWLSDKITSIDIHPINEMYKILGGFLIDHESYYVLWLIAKQNEISTSKVDIVPDLEFKPSDKKIHIIVDMNVEDRSLEAAEEYHRSNENFVLTEIKTPEIGGSILIRPGG